MRSHNSMNIFIQITLESDFGIRFSNMTWMKDPNVTEIWLNPEWVIRIISYKDKGHLLCLCQRLSNGNLCPYHEFNLTPEASILEQDKDVLLWLNQVVAHWREHASK